MAKPTPAFTTEQIKAALIKAKGYYYLAANHLKCHAKTIERYVEKYPALKEIVTQFRGKRIDQVEEVLSKKALAGEPWAVIFFLKTQGRSRGYTERYDFSHEYKNMSDADLAKFIQERTGADIFIPGGGSAPRAEDSTETVH